jgi:hypothetical protein
MVKIYNLFLYKFPEVSDLVIVLGVVSDLKDMTDELMQYHIVVNSH